VVAIDGPPIF